MIIKVKNYYDDESSTDIGSAASENTSSCDSDVGNIASDEEL